MAKKPATPKKPVLPVPPEASPAITPADMPPAPPVGPITSAAAPPAHAGPPPKIGKALLNKVMLNVPPTLVFRKGFHEAVRGDLRPGTTVTLSYDAERLPREKENVPNWTAYAHLRFGNGEGPITVPLWSPTGVILSKTGNDTGEGTMLTAAVEVPADAQEVEVWFSLDLGNGNTFWDSSNGQNYHFRFTHAVIVTHAAIVVPASAVPNDDLEVTIETDSDVVGVAIDYQVTNTVPDPPLNGAAVLQPAAELNAKGCREWTARGVCVPHRAVVYFTIRYTAGGHEFKDDNNRRGYLVS